MKTLCIYHIADHDGKGSGGIVKSVYPNTNFLGFNHDMSVPYDKIEKYHRIVICDIALPIEYMFELSKTKELIWIDHHISVINEYEELMKTGKYEPIEGLRKNGTAACELTWQYFYPNKEIPLGLKLLALNDLFQLEDPRVRPFEYAIQSMGVNRPNEPIWEQLINNEINIEETVAKGNAILDWIKIRNYRLARGMVFESEFMGMKCLCANMPQGYSEFFDSVENKHKFDFFINFYMNKKNHWKFSIYTEKDDVDVSKIAAYFGGGGHKKASGATTEKLPKFLDLQEKVL
ncbi:MAG: DHHA1 domain-containing protein [Alphaproteobacteria bacterium]